MSTEPEPAPAAEPAPAFEPAGPHAVPPFASDPFTADPFTADPFATDPFAAEAAPKSSRRPRTAVLLVGALLLGPLLGGGVGYAIQAGRPPTPLPPLQLSVSLKYPAGVLDPKAAAAAAPQPLSIDGDLRKLLLTKPDDAKDWNNFGYESGDGWESVGDMARSSGRSANAFKNLLQDGVRRTALAAWQKGDVKYRISLVQYFSDSSQNAIDETALGQGSKGFQTFGGGMEGGYGAPTDVRTYAETNETFYYGYANTRRGDVMVSIEVFAPSQVNADEVKDLAKRQWERLA